MQSKDLHQIKAAIRDQAFLGNARVFCIMGPVVAARRRKGQLLAMIRGWGRWYPEKVSERMKGCVWAKGGRAQCVEKSLCKI